MLSARTIYGEIFDNDEAFGLFCSIAASGEAQGGWENGKIAALVPGSQAGEEELTEANIVTYLAHSRGTEQCASEQMRALRRHAGDRADIARAIRVISHDEDNHLAYCHEELLRLAAAGHA